MANGRNNLDILISGELKELILGRSILTRIYENLDYKKINNEIRNTGNRALISSHDAAMQEIRVAIRHLDAATATLKNLKNTLR